MKKVRAIIIFDDYLEGVTRYIGDIFEVTDERYNEIITKGGNWVEVVEDEEKEQDLSKFKKTELEKLAKEKGINDKEIKGASKEALIEMLRG